MKTPQEIGISESEFEAFEVQALEEVEAEAMVEANAEEYTVAVATAPFTSLPSKPRTEDIMEEEE